MIPATFAKISSMVAFGTHTAPRLVRTLWALILGVLILQSAVARPPNIIVILTDDQGYGDISAHGNPTLATPNLDRLERESRSFRNFFVSPTCAPTRSALMTGRHEFFNGITHTILERERLAPNAVTLAETLRDAGYATGIFGKWHLGDEEAYRPNRRGFQEFFIHGAGGIGQSYAGSCGDAPGNQYTDPYILHNGRFEKTTGYCTDVFFDQAKLWMDRQRSKGPFLCWIATNAPHDPYIARPQDAALYAKPGIDPKLQNFFGMIHNIDQNVGELLAQLDRWQIASDTLVIFMNDNGSAIGAQHFNAGMRGAKGSPWLGGTRANAFWRWPGHIAPGPCDALTAHVDLFATLAKIAQAPLSPTAQAQIEGRDLGPLLRDPNHPWDDRTLITHVGRWPKGTDPNEFRYRQASIRNTRYTLVSPSGGREPAWELFDVIEDPGQKNNVLAQQPEIATKLANQFDAWWDSVQPCLVNEQVDAPEENSFKTLFREQMRPNIVWIIVEDMSAHFSCYGETTITTPNVDALARTGVRFTRAFVTAPICSISRSALITGMYQTSIGGQNHRSSVPGHPISLPQGVRIVPEILRDAGYHCNNVTWEDFLRSDQDLKTKPNVPVAKTDYNFEWKPDAAYDAAHWKLRASEKPFFVQIQLHGGKFRGQAPTPQWPERVKRELGSVTARDAVRLPPYLPDDEVIRDDWAQYLDCVRYTDHQVGTIVERLKQEGVWDNTYVFFMTDHGISHVRNKQFLYDGGVHVPLIVHVPRSDTPAVRDDLVEHIDLAATTLSVSNIDRPEKMQGRSLFGEVQTPERQAVFAARDRADETVDMIRSVRTKNLKYIRNGFPNRPYLQPNAYKDSKAIVQAMRRLHAEGKLTPEQSLIMAETRPLEELYDLENDPYELYNLADQPEWKERLDAMRSRLSQWRRESKDTDEPESESIYELEAAAEHIEGGKGNRSPEYRANLETMRRWRSEKPFHPFP
ncbi:MAG: sulfatase-like hydrolase/transferase [Planctomycetota bacterium]